MPKEQETVQSEELIEVGEAESPPENVQFNGEVFGSGEMIPEPTYGESPQ